MAEENIQNQMNAINEKLDLVLHYVNQQRLKTEMMEDLVTDVSIIGKDIFNDTVNELDNQGIELDMEAVKLLVFKLIKNIPNFTGLVDMFESINDFLQDVGPIAKEMIIDFIKKLYEYEKRGYFEYLKEMGSMLSTIHEHYTIDDFKSLTANVGSVMNIAKSLTSPEFLKTAEKAVLTINELKIDDKLDDKSLFKLYKEFKSPEVRKFLSYILRLVKTISSDNKINEN